MKRWLFLLSVVFSLGAAHAQRGYVGGNVTLLTDGRYPALLFGVQAGVGLAERLELRSAFETNVSGSSLSADLLYRLPFSALALYLGAGPEVLFSPLASILPAQATPLGNPNVGLHATVGLEYHVGRFGVFGDVQPILTLDYPHFGYAKVRSGVNVYF